MSNNAGNTRDSYTVWLNRAVDAWYDSLLNALGAEELLEETYRALSTEQAASVLTYIANNHDIED